MVIENYEADQERKWPLGHDLVEECQVVASLSQDDYADKVPLFDPYVFNEEHGPLLVEEYRINQNELQ